MKSKFPYCLHPKFNRSQKSTEDCLGMDDLRPPSDQFKSIKEETMTSKPPTTTEFEDWFKPIYEQYVEGQTSGKQKS